MKPRPNTKQDSPSAPSPAAAKLNGAGDS
jgi:hypothetical protein